MTTAPLRLFRDAVPLAWRALALIAVLPAIGSAQVGTPDCGGEGERACTLFDAEFWANNRECDYGLTNSTDRISFFVFGKSGACVNDNRRTIAKHASWAAWALHEQRDGIQGDLPLNAVTTLGTHNSFSNYRDGNTNVLSTNQYYSITDQLQLGARDIRVDPVYFYDQMRVCHASPYTLVPAAPDIGTPEVRSAEKNLCEVLGIMSFLGVAEVFIPIAGVLNLAPPPVPFLVDGVIVAAAGYTSAQHINGRLFSMRSRKSQSGWMTIRMKSSLSSSIRARDRTASRGW